MGWCSFASEFVTFRRKTGLIFFYMKVPVNPWSHSTSFHGLLPLLKERVFFTKNQKARGD
jgi:hypothetical protein